jgi:hypothetical protein
MNDPELEMSFEDRLRHEAEKAKMTGTALMSRKGRTRSAGDRYPSGRLKSIKGIAPASIKRMVAMAQVGAADPLLATQLGWLQLMKITTPKQTAAGVIYAGLVGQHDRVMGFPRRSTASPSYEQGFVGSGAQGGPEFEAAYIAKVRERFDSAHRVLIGKGITASRTVHAVCVENRSLDWDSHEHFENGLDALADHFRLNEKQRA